MTTRTLALIVAAGRGHRAGGGLPKQYRALQGRTVLRRTIDALLASARVDAVKVVIHPDDHALYEAAIGDDPRLLPPAIGGQTRAESVRNGLAALGSGDAVLIHDAARPFLSTAVIDSALDALHDADGAVASLPAIDAMRRVAADGALGEGVERTGIIRAQTPQAFRLAPLRQAFAAAEAQGTLTTALDDAEVAAAHGLHVVATTGDPQNFKLTTPEDFAMAERLLAPQIRVGHGYDVHAFEPGEAVILCGVSIPHAQKLKGHSDADVGLHTLTDAIYGALADGDIGRHFPPSDPQWKGTDSAVFLRHAVSRATEAGYDIANLDITLICEQPKIGPHSTAMRTRVAELCALPIDRVSVKATTSERLGFTGREEGIAATATVTLLRV